MQMTPEEAIKILDPETSRGTLWKYEDKEERLEAVNEACRLAVAALRAQHKLNVPLTLCERAGQHRARPSRSILHHAQRHQTNLRGHAGADGH